MAVRPSHMSPEEFQAHRDAANAAAAAKSKFDNDPYAAHCAMAKSLETVQLAVIELLKGKPAAKKAKAK